MEHATLIFCDIVGFSLNDDDFQTQLICKLNAEVTHQLFDRLSEAEPSVIFLPTGDGLAVTLLDKSKASIGTAEKAELFALIDRLMRFAVGNQPRDGETYLRIGVHRGGVSLIRDINGHLNVCGHAMNDCQRIMDAARANQVLFSSEGYRTLAGGRRSYSGAPFDETTPAQFSDPLSVVDKHLEKHDVHIMFREGEKGWEKAEPMPRGLIAGKIERTLFIVKQLRELLLQPPETQIAVYEQSALSTFGIADRKVWGDSESPEYVALISEQKDLLMKLAAQDRTTVKLILRPIRRHESSWMKPRCEALLKWLRESIARPQVSFVVVDDHDDYEGPNRLIIEDHFCIEGYKPHDTSGFELSFLKTSAHEIKEALESFNRVFQKLDRGKEGVINYFEELSKS